MSEKIRQLKKEMIQVYGNECWMNYLVTKRNFISAHHIQELRNCGKTEWGNIALITTNAHQYLNYLDREEHKIYRELNGLFKELNLTYLPPAEDYFEELDHILRRVR